MVEADALTLGAQLLTQLLTPLSRANIDDALALDTMQYALHMFELIIHISNYI